MNPLSSHPPRSPRPSTVSSSSAINIYGSQNIYEPSEATVPAEADKEEMDEAEAEELHELKPVPIQVRKEEVAQQSVPYSAEVSTEKSKKMSRPFLHTLLYAPPPVLLELIHAFSDDAATLSLLGLFGKKFGDRAGRFSDWCWLIATLVGLVENGVERQMIGNLQHDIETRLYSESMTGTTAKSKPKGTKLDEKELSRLRKQDYWLQISRAKLVMDLIFVSYDIFKIRRFNESVKTFTGLTAAILSSLKLYHGQHNVILKKLM
ncbi:hypothetical protein C0991_005952 [Blastosporella zonata]|nr:hypothetical protein C0991_005952 [Blastosporella zonata]